MEINIVWIAKLFGIANIAAVAVLLFLALKPLFGCGVFGVTFNGWRYGYGSGGWTIQHTRTYEVARTGYFPWYSWRLNRYRAD